MSDEQRKDRVLVVAARLYAEMHGKLPGGDEQTAGTNKLRLMISCVRDAAALVAIVDAEAAMIKMDVNSITATVAADPHCVRLLQVRSKAKADAAAAQPAPPSASAPAPAPAPVQPAPVQPEPVQPEDGGGQ